MHNIKLLIIQNPKWCAKQVAYEAECSMTTVYRAYRELNIPRGEKPTNYVG